MRNGAKKFRCPGNYSSADKQSDSSEGEVIVVETEDSNSNYTDTSVRMMSNDGTSS